MKGVKEKHLTWHLILAGHHEADKTDSVLLFK